MKDQKQSVRGRMQKSDHGHGKQGKRAGGGGVKKEAIL